MSFIKTIVISLSCFMFTSLAFAAEKEGEAVNAMKVMVDFQRAHTAMSVAVTRLHIAYLDLGKGDPDLDALEQVGKQMEELMPTYEDRAVSVRSLFESNGLLASQAGFEDVKRFSSEQSLAVLKKLSGTAVQLADSAVQFQFEVNSRYGWQSTEYEVPANAFLILKPEGSWTTDKDERPFTDWRGYPPAKTGVATHGALVYRVNDGSMDGEDSPLARTEPKENFNLAGGPGVLEFRANDEPYSGEDNEGFINVTVYMLDADLVDELMSIF